MPTKYRGLAVCDLLTIQVLKIQDYKSLPGGIFSLIFSLLNLGILVTIVLLWILEPRKMLSQAYKPTEKPIDSLPYQSSNSSINVAITSRGSARDISTIDIIDLHFILVRYYRIEFKIHAQLYQSTKKQSEDKKVSLTYQVPVNDLITSQKETGFPRLAIESCAFFNEDKEHKDIYLIVDNPELLSKCPSKEDFDKFYALPTIKDHYFQVSFTFDYHQMQTDFLIKTLKKTYELYFQFEKMTFDSYITQLNKIVIQEDAKKKKEEYNNWLLPDYQILALLGVNNHYSLHILFNSKFNDMAVLFVIYKYGFLYYLQNLGSCIRIVDILTFLPSIWLPYYACLLVIKYYSKIEHKQSLEDIGEDYSWSTLGYCQWLSIKFGCSSRKRRLNQRINDMRYLVAAEFEKLYSSPNKEKEQIKHKSDDQEIESSINLSQAI